MGDYGHFGVPNLASRLWSTLKLAAEISQISDANYPVTWLNVASKSNYAVPPQVLHPAPILREVEPGVASRGKKCSTWIKLTGRLGLIWIICRKKMLPTPPRLCQLQIPTGS